MTDEEALRLLRDVVAEYEAASWDELRPLMDHQVYCERVAPSGTKFATETDVMWDDREGGTIRVEVEIMRYDGREWTAALARETILTAAPA